MALDNWREKNMISYYNIIGRLFGDDDFADMLDGIPLWHGEESDRGKAVRVTSKPKKGDKRVGAR